MDSFRRLGGHDAPDVLRVVPIRDQDRLLARSRFVTGLSLRKIIDLRHSVDQRFELHEVGPRIFQLVRALEQLHRTAHHGFLKPSNIILEPEGVRITDFGLMQALPRAAFVRSQQDAGAFVYLAPEVRSDNRRTSVPMYSVGAILFELLAGRAYQEDGPSLGECLAEPGRSMKQIDSLIAQATAIGRKSL